MATNTCGGGIDQTAVIGHAPESREWRKGDTAYPPVIKPSARIEAFVTVDAGVNQCTYVGERSWLMKHAHVGHDVHIGDDCELSPGVVVGGYAVIGNDVRIGIGALVRPCVNIGDGARVGMGAVVVKDVPAGALVYGNPAREHKDPAPSRPQPIRPSPMMTETRDGSRSDGLRHFIWKLHQGG